MPALSTWPPFPGPNRPTTLDTDTQAFFNHLGGTFTTEVNNLADYLANSARPAFSVAAIFDATTTDADPGAGKWRLNNATQNSSTFVYADLADANGADMTAIIEAMDDSTSTTKGWLRFSVNGDRTKWLLAKVTGAITTASGYRKIPITMIAWSAASPITAPDKITVAFTPNGDKGDTGANGPWTNIMSAASISGSPSVITFNSIPSGYADLKFDWKGVSLSASDNIQVSVTTDGTNWTAYTTVTTSSLTGYDGDVTVVDYLGPRPRIVVNLGAALGSSPALGASNVNSAHYLTNLTSGLVGIRFKCSSSSTFGGGTIQPRAR